MAARLIAFVLLAIASAGAGCGGDDDESAERSETAATAPRATTTPARGAPSDSTPRRRATLTAASTGAP